MSFFLNDSRSSIRRCGLRVFWQGSSICNTRYSGPDRRFPPTVNTSAGRKQRSARGRSSQKTHQRSLHLDSSGRDHFRQHGHCHDGALAAHLDDKHDELRELAVGRRFSAREHFVSYRHEFVRPHFAQDRPLALLLDRPHCHRRLFDISKTQ